MASIIYKKSQIIKNNLDDLKKHVKEIFNESDFEQERKSLLKCIFDEFPFIHQILDQGPLKNFESYFLSSLKTLYKVTRVIEPPTRSLYEIPWLLDRMTTLGQKMMQIQPYSEVLISLERLCALLQNSASTALRELFSVNKFHFKALEVKPVLDPMTPVCMEVAISKLSEIQEKYSAMEKTEQGYIAEDISKSISSGLSYIHHSNGALPSGLDRRYRAKDAFIENINIPYMLSEIAKFLNFLRSPHHIPAFFKEMFAEPLTIFKIHEMLLKAAFLLYHEHFTENIKEDEIFTDDDSTFTSLQLYEGAKKVFLSTVNRLSIVGTPSEDTSEIENFYAILRQCLVQLMTGICTTQDRAAILYGLSELGIAGHFCGTRWIGCLFHQLRFLKGTTEPNDLIDMIYFYLRSKREILLLDLAKEQNVHLHNQLMKLVATELGLPGVEIFESIQDKLSDPHLTANHVLTLFNTKYHPLYIMRKFDVLLKEYYKKSEMRELLMQWIKENIPEDMNAAFYQPIITAVKQALVEKKSREAITSLMKDIYWSPDESNPLLAIRNHQFLTFVDDYAMDEMGRFRLPFVLHMLLKINVLNLPSAALKIL